MDFFQWSNELNVGNKLIDQDHQALVMLVNELHQASISERSGEVLEKILRALFTYTQEHFAREEILMEHINYPEFASHKAQHQRLLDQVIVLQEAFNRGRRTVPIDTAELLRYWLLHHIMRTDRKLAGAVREAGLVEA